MESEDESRSPTNNRDNDDESEDDEKDDHVATTEQVLHRIECLICGVVDALDHGRLPVLETFRSDKNHRDDDESIESAGTATTTTRKIRKNFSLQQARSMTSIVLVLDYCYQLLQQHKTTTVREVYYAHVTHFRNQNECDIAIRDAAVLLHVPRHSLGLQASAKGWFCGDVQIIRRNNNQNDNHSDDEGPDVLLDGRQLWHSVHGSIIGSEWLDSPQRRNFTVQTVAAHCILVIEKEGIYRRLAQDRFFDDWPCILVTGKGFPDLSTRAFVHGLHTTLQLPVWGLADGNPFGVLVLNTYARGSLKRGLDGGDRYSVPIQWVGLRASQMEILLTTTDLPPAVVQPLAALDIQRINKTLLNERGHGWVDTPDERINEARYEELEDLLEGGTKMELEALHWLGMDYLGEWLSNIFEYNLEERNEDEDSVAHLEIL
eukprot:scaffold1953_cov176-Amphora_coffeaeformis.AAC.13